MIACKYWNENEVWLISGAAWLPYCLFGLFGKRVDIAFNCLSDARKFLTENNLPFNKKEYLATEITVY